MLALPFHQAGGPTLYSTTCNDHGKPSTIVTSTIFTTALQALLCSPACRCEDSLHSLHHAAALFAFAEAGQPKAEWPELQGKTVEEAKAVLQQEAPGFQIQVIGPDMMATMEWRCDRIRLWLDKQQRVSQAPRVG